MSLSNLLRFLVGHRDAILALARDRRSLPISILLVFGAALARRYDRAYLLAEPWHLVMPLLVSLVNGSILFGLLALCFLRKADPRPSWGEAYRVLLALFWLTAPLAFLYAIPVERFLDPYGAAVANLSLLGLVALWRVVLYARAVSVVFGMSFASVFFAVLLFADAIVLAFLFLSPKPIVAVMGGLMHSPADAMLIEVGIYVLAVAAASAPVWLVMAVVCGWGKSCEWRACEWRAGEWRAELDDAATASEGELSSARSAWIFALGTIVAWLPILPFTQAEQRLAWQVDDALAEERIREAIGFLVVHDPEDFPPHFDPRPRFWEGAESPSVWAVLAEMDESEMESWVGELYMAKAERTLRSHLFRIRGTDDHLPWARASLRHPEVVELSLQWNLRPFSVGLDVEPESELGQLLEEIDRRHIDPLRDGYRGPNGSGDSEE